MLPFGCEVNSRSPPDATRVVACRRTSWRVRSTGECRRLAQTRSYSPSGSVVRSAVRNSARPPRQQSSRGRPRSVRYRCPWSASHAGQARWDRRPHHNPGRVHARWTGWRRGPQHPTDLAGPDPTGSRTPLLPQAHRCDLRPRGRVLHSGVEVPGDEGGVDASAGEGPGADGQRHLRGGLRAVAGRPDAHRGRGRLDVHVGRQRKQRAAGAGRRRGTLGSDTPASANPSQRSHSFDASRANSYPTSLRRRNASVSDRSGEYILID